MEPDQSAESVRRCQFTYGSNWCEATKTRTYATHDGGEVVLCIKHRGWLPALGRHSDGGESGE